MSRLALLVLALVLLTLGVAPGHAAAQPRTLPRGCTPVSGAWTGAIAASDLAAAVTPTSALSGLWGQGAAGRYRAWSPDPGAPNDLLSIGPGDTVQVCVRAPATLGRVEAAPVSTYPIHRNITATVFWVGEPQGGGSSENNAISAWDDDWLAHYGGVDDPANRNGFFPAGFTPKQNPFYFDLPYNDFTDDGDRRANAYAVVPWANEKTWGPQESMLKNRWIKITKDANVCYAQWEDAGPYVYDDAAYVFGTARPKNKQANSAGMDVSPAVRDCLGFNGINNAENQVDWQFVDAGQVPDGPWKRIVTTSQVFWK